MKLNLALAFTLAVSAAMAQSVAVNPNIIAGGLIDTSTLSSNFADFGVGIQGNALNGLALYCHSVGPVNYVCAKTKYSGSTTSNTVEGKQVLFARGGVIGMINGSVGVATGANAGVGGAYTAGGMVKFDVSRVPIHFLQTHKGYFVGVMADYDKRDVSTFVGSLGTVQGLRTSLKPFVTSGDYNLTLGKQW